MSEAKSLYLVMVDPNNNNNKYYKMDYTSGDTFSIEYGRIGQGKQTETYSISMWEKKRKEKLKKGYVDMTSLVADETKKIKSDKKYIDIPDRVIAEIVERLQARARKTVEENYTVSSTAVSKKMIEVAQHLIDKLVSENNLIEFNEILLDLFRVIPRKMNINRGVKDYMAKSNEDFGKIIQSEQDLLDVMHGQVATHDAEEDEDDNIEKFDRTILDIMGLVIEQTTDEDIKIIKNSLGDIKDKFHKAWKVKSIKTQEKFDKFVNDNNIKERKLLWHGSRNENWWSIICNGLVLRPQAVITGKLFGNGIYYAPKAQKSLGYTSINGSYWAKGGESSGFMSLYDVAYGIPYNVYDFDNKFNNLDYNGLQRLCPNSNCLHAHAGANLGNSRLRNDEIVFYQENQITIKYLVELR